MEIRCPKHNMPLEISKTEMDLLNDRYYVVQGKCPKCSTVYLNRQLIGDRISYGGVSYEILPSLANEYPYDVIEEIRFFENQDAARKKSRDKEKPGKNAAAHRTDTEVQPDNIRQQMQRNPEMVYRPKKIKYVSEIPKICPADGTEVVFVKNLPKNAHNVKSGYCCLTCSKLFIIKEPEKARKTHSERTLPEEKTSTESTSLTPLHEVQKAQKILALPSAIVNPPKSTLFVLSLSVDGNNVGSMAIVRETEDQDSGNGLFGTWRSVAQAAIPSIISTLPHPSFIFDGVVYRIEKVNRCQDADEFLKHIKTEEFCDMSCPQTVYVFSSKTISAEQSSDFETVAAYIPCEKAEMPIAATVYYQRSRDIYYMNSVEYNNLCAKYGLPYLYVQTAEGFTGRSYADMNPESKLHILGYNVSSASGMSDSERQHLLAKLIDSSLITKAEIKSHLEWLIHSNESKPNMVNAVDRWKNDLKFVDRYKMDRARSVFVDKFKAMK